MGKCLSSASTQSTFVLNCHKKLFWHQSCSIRLNAGPFAVERTHMKGHRDRWLSRGNPNVQDIHNSGLNTATVAIIAHGKHNTTFECDVRRFGELQLTVVVVDDQSLTVTVTYFNHKNGRIPTYVSYGETSGQKVLMDEGEHLWQLWTLIQFVTCVFFFHRDLHPFPHPLCVCFCGSLGSEWTMMAWGTHAAPALRRPPSWWPTTSPWRQTRSSGLPVAAITSPAFWSESVWRRCAAPQMIWSLKVPGLEKKRHFCFLKSETFN